MLAAIKIVPKGIKLMFLPRDKVLRLPISKRLSIFGFNKPGYGLRGAYLRGFSIEPEIEKLELFLEPTDTFIDVGCSTGVYTLRASMICRKVFAIDANSEMTNCLLKTITYNNILNVEVFNVGVGSVSKTISFYSNSNKPNSYSFVQHDQSSSKRDIACKPLDAILQNSNFTRIKYIKIDVEGFESEVIAGAMKLILEFRPIIQVENIFGLPEEIPVNYQVWSLNSSSNSLLIPNEFLDSNLNLEKLVAAGFKKNS